MGDFRNFHKTHRDQNIKDVYEQAEWKAKTKELGYNRLYERFRKAPLLVEKYGVAVKVGSCLYPVPVDVTRYVFKTLNKKNIENHVDWVKINSHIGFFSKSGERIARRKLKGPIVTQLEKWKELKAYADDVAKMNKTM